jgi:hypothetical protein
LQRHNMTKTRNKIPAKRSDFTVGLWLNYTGYSDKNVPIGSRFTSAMHCLKNLTGTFWLKHPVFGDDILFEMMNIRFQEFWQLKIHYNWLPGTYHTFLPTQWIWGTESFQRCKSSLWPLHLMALLNRVANCLWNLTPAGFCVEIHVVLSWPHDFLL